MTFDPAPSQYDVRTLALQPDGRIVVGAEGLWRVEGDPVPSFRDVTRQANGDLRLSLKSQPGQTYTLETSTNLVSWSPLHTRLATDCTLQFTTPAGSASARFYRVVQSSP